MSEFLIRSRTASCFKLVGPLVIGWYFMAFQWLKWLNFLTSELLTKDYTETYYREGGSRVTSAPNDIVRTSAFIVLLLSESQHDSFRLPIWTLTQGLSCLSLPGSLLLSREDRRPEQLVRQHQHMWRTQVSCRLLFQLRREQYCMKWSSLSPSGNARLTCWLGLTSKQVYGALEYDAQDGLDCSFIYRIEKQQLVTCQS